EYQEKKNTKTAKKITNMSEEEATGLSSVLDCDVIDSEDSMFGDNDNGFGRCQSPVLTVKDPKECVFKDFGCRFKGPSAELKEHEHNKSVHFDMLFQFALRLESEKKHDQLKLQVYIDNFKKMEAVFEETHKKLKA
ncbi:unnamed protein product, partial [Lymnaea stagnalis]